MNLPTFRKTVSLVKEIISKTNPGLSSNIGPVYSIAIKESIKDNAPSVQTAHEHDMSNLRDSIQQGEEAFDISLITCSIKPANEIKVKKSNPDCVRQVRMQSLSGAKNTPGVKSNTTSFSNAKKAAPPRKMTTAASFFGKPTATSKSKSTNVKAQSKPKIKSSKAKISKPKKKETDDFINDESSIEEEYSDEDTVDKSVSIDDDKGPSSSRKSKRLASSQGHKSIKKSKPIYGNADDFVGDEDEDEEDEKLDKERKKRIALGKMKEIREIALKSNNPTKPKKMVSRELVQKERLKLEKEANGESEGEDDETSTKKHGAMDSFTQRKTSPMVSQVSRKRQRKKMVEKTSMDEKGYIHTETVTVWEDIPSDEELEKENNSNQSTNAYPVGKKQKTLGVQASTASSTRPTGKSVVKKKPKKNMKQAGLMGFFTKK